jgi:hypothetical protein
MAGETPAPIVGVDSGAIDRALLALLNGDTALRALVPGAYLEGDVPPHATRFVQVSLIDAPDDPNVFGGRAFEQPLYLVVVVERESLTESSTIQAAAARIDRLLDPHPPLTTPPTIALTVPGYGVLMMQREIRVSYTRHDDVDLHLRWRYRGGHYRIMLAPADGGAVPPTWIQQTGWVQAI